MRVYAIVLAAGKGERFGRDKVLEDLGGRPVWKWSFDALLSHPRISGVGVVASKDNLDLIQRDAAKAIFVVQGGEFRSDSVRIGLERIPSNADAILVHDGARPFVSHSLISRVIEGVEANDAAAAAVRPADSIRYLGSGELIDRDAVVCMQTPQGARGTIFKKAMGSGGPHTDDAAYLEAAGYKVDLVQGEADNFKITTVEDLQRARGMLGGETRTGIGYDVHRFSADPARPLFLGGVRFEDGPGLEGHSDADVVVHAAVDALLGAAALGDIGQHFPPSDPNWKDQPSLNFLRHASGLLGSAGWKVVNVDVAIMAEAPRIMPRAVEMREAMSTVLGVRSDRVSVKATTNEGLGAIGRGEGIAAFATATISRNVALPSRR
ncbi:MAG: 2-C-methyl-D-erythritol 4-phosphate cytidylyltransferase [Fimbriimonadaceae bacterium]|jgi:2-C-methyl-D-erythritol 4-phosphate cytidylyltransferase/2-C-methyl-D-erythritol 2,4-cyclodiphosphate synthase|nr:2-C-methyl-D-erythritol 4-phosphate cytidylyltransferase [Fimbriimonadaceae bacterium]